MTETRLLSAKDYFEKITQPAYQQFQQNQSFLTAYTLAMALFHISEWIWHHNESEVQAKFNVGSAGAFWAYVESQVTDAGLIRDMNNAGKHVVISQRPSTTMRHAANTSIQSVGYGERYGQAYGGGTIINLDEGGRQVNFADVAALVFNFWATLVNELSP